MPSERKGKERREEKVESGELEQIVQNAIEETTFERWERGAKKQYVRQNGWVEIIRNYAESRLVDGYREPLKYLTLPGRSAMDIGLLRREGLLSRLNDDGPLNVAICDESKGSEIANRLAKFGGVLAFSDRLLHDELRGTGNPIPSEFPFDVINLDFCNSLLRLGQDNLDSIQWIFEYQNGKSFLLLLTAREYPNEGGYLNLIKQNLREERMFSEAYARRYGSLDIENCIGDTRAYSQIIFPKVVGRFARKYAYKTIEHFAGHYLREPEQSNRESYNMVCHSFELEPVNRKGANKHEQRYAYPGRDRIDEVLGNPKYKHALEKASGEYSAFVASLLVDRSRDIDQLLQDPLLQKSLDDQGNDLADWINADE